MELFAEITGIKYTPFLCKTLKVFPINSLKTALSTCGAFALNKGNDRSAAVSWWVSAKRTRAYPYARIYDTLVFPGKRITIIPIMKDEGIEGDRDFLQWDTISLMSLLGLYVVISFYTDAENSTHYKGKITNQRFDTSYLRGQIEDVLSYQSDALHWNIAQVDKAGVIATKAVEAYAKISEKLSVPMHSVESANRRVSQLLKGKDNFITLSRKLAKRAQARESQTVQPKENLTGIKAELTIRNYLGGYYFLTVDEAWIASNDLYLAEAKHTMYPKLPSLSDVKGGLIKMMLFSNLQSVGTATQKYNPVAVLKLTTANDFSKEQLGVRDKRLLETLKEEANHNRFKILINTDFLDTHL